MSQEKFEVTPSNFTRQMDVDYRSEKETVTFAELESARNKCKKWIADNKDHLTTTNALPPQA